MAEITIEQVVQMASAHQEAGRLAEAEYLCRQVLAAVPHQPDCLHLLGIIAFLTGHSGDAETLIKEAISLMPSHAACYSNLATVLRAQGRLTEARDSLHTSLRLDPARAETHVMFALLLLLLGDFQTGWNEYEWRWRMSRFTSSPRFSDARRWEGLPAPGETILVHAEQGFGDTIHFARYVPLVQARSGARRVIFECQPELVSLLVESGGTNADVVGKTGDDDKDLPPFQRHVPSMSLARVLGFLDPADPTNPAVPYLRADERRRAAWRARLPEDGEVRVGLCWSGSRVHVDDQQRSVALECFVPLADIPGVRLFSLQLPGPSGLPTPPSGINLIDFSVGFRDFAETAAFISELDLVISVDTAVAHLAGALGKPVWTLLAAVSDWRWGVAGERTPWYPTMRLFRQRAMPGWEPVLAEVAAALREFARGPGVSRHGRGAG